MVDDHDLDLQIFRNNPNYNWEVSSSYKLQLPSAALSIPSSPSPQLPKTQVQEAGKLWMPWDAKVPEQYPCIDRIYRDSHRERQRDRDRDRDRDGDRDKDRDRDR